MPEVSKYYEWERLDIIIEVPPTATTVLSVGCGAGVTESVLVDSGKSVVGIEISSPAALQAREKGIEVIEGDAAEVASSLKGRTFDCMIFGDSLEHMQHPESVLAEYLPLLSAHGTLIISVPNFRHFSVARALFLHGEFRYTSAGIFDQTHLRITTRKSVMRWMSDMNMGIVNIRYNILPRRYRLLSMVTMGILRDFLATQVLVVAKRNPAGT